MKLMPLVFVLMCSIVGEPVAAQSLPRATPESVGLSSTGLDEATASLQAHINASDIPGVVAAVARHGELVYFEALGLRDRERGAAMPPDALFRLYSMTRPITSTAVMMLWARRSHFAIPAPIFESTGPH